MEDACRCFFVEKFTGTQSYNRPFWSYSLPGASFIDNLWHEPVPFNLSSEYGMAMAHHGDYCWLSTPDGVWRAKLTQQSIDLTDDVLWLRQEVRGNLGRLTVELRNDSGQYASPGEVDLLSLDIGCQLGHDDLGCHSVCSAPLSLPRQRLAVPHTNAGAPR